MRQKLKIVFLVAPVVFVLDQLTKWLIVRHVSFGTRRPVWEHFFDIVHTRNKGAAFGILSDWDSAQRDLFFYFLSALAVFFLFYFLREIPAQKKMGAFPVALILGGAMGNISDRIFRGSVVDFLSFHWHDSFVSFSLWGLDVDFPLVWPAFNVADSAITVGVFWLMIVMMKKSPLPPFVKGG